MAELLAWIFFFTPFLLQAFCLFLSASKSVKTLNDIEPIKNIALTRNKAITLGRGNLIATVDDDEIVDKWWLWHLFTALNEYNADVVFGSVVPIYEVDPPAFIKESAIFDIPSPTTGSSTGFIYNTSSSLFRRDILQHLSGPFDFKFGLTGGSDTHFFNRLKLLGMKLVWSRESIAYHLIPKGRTNLKWIFQREFRHGNTYHSIWGKSPFFIEVPMWMDFLLCMVCIPLFLLLSLVGGTGSLVFTKLRPKAVWWFRRLGFYVGLMASFFQYRFKEYNKVFN